MASVQLPYYTLCPEISGLVFTTHAHGCVLESTYARVVLMHIIQRQS